MPDKLTHASDYVNPDFIGVDERKRLLIVP
jgi:hypothetical protein